MGFLNRTGAEISYNLIKSAKKSFFIIENAKKYRKCPALIIFAASPATNGLKVDLKLNCGLLLFAPRERNGLSSGFNFVCNLGLGADGLKLAQ